MLWPVYAFVVASLASAAGPSANFTHIETFRQCEPALIEWEGGEGPFVISVNGGDPSVQGDRKILYSTFDHSFVWMVDVPEGVEFALTVLDEAHPDPKRIEGGMKIQAGPNNCTLYGQPPPNSTSSAAPQQNSKSKANVGAIVGGVVGGVLGGLIILGLLLWNLLLRRRLKGQEAEINKYKQITPFETPAAAKPLFMPTLRDSVDVQPPSDIASTVAVHPPAPRPEAFGQKTSTASTARASSSTQPLPSTQTQQVDPTTAESLHEHASRASESQYAQDGDTVQSQYEQDGGPIPTPPGRVVHPPKYNSVWKT